MKIYNNIEFLQLNFDEFTDNFYFPQNSKVAGKKIDSIGFLAKSNDGTLSAYSHYSPFDGREVVGYADLQNMYIDIINDNKEVLHSKVPAISSDLLNRSRIAVDSKIDLEMCCVYYAGDPADLLGKCLLAYVTYDTIEEIDVQPTPMQSITIIVDNAPSQVKLSDYIQDYIIANKKTIKAVSCIVGNGLTPFYLDLRDYAGRSFRYVHSFSMLVPNRNLGIYYKDLLMLADFNVDFFNSYIIAANPNITNNYNITFYYE